MYVTPTSRAAYFGLSHRRGPALGGPDALVSPFSRLKSPPYARTPSKTALPTALTQGLPRCTLKLSAHFHWPHWQRSRCSSGMLRTAVEKAPALPPGAHRHVPRALWLFARKRECRHLISLRTGVLIAESHYLARRYRMMCSSITQLLFDFFRNSSPTTFEPADKRRVRC